MKVLNLALMLSFLVLGWFTPSFAAKPDYQLVFPEDKVADFKIIIAPADWTAMQDNMKKLYGEPGKPRPRPNPEDKPGDKPGENPRPPSLPKEKPMWVNAKIVFNGQTWQNVAVRYKGNSSLMFSWMTGNHKLPFKIDFEKFDSKKRKFHGFTELALSNNFADETYLREPLAYRLFDHMGLPTSHTALYRLTLDYGAGEKDYGIYTSVEVTNDTVVGDFFGEDKGNIYEGDGNGVTLNKDVAPEQLKAAFQKENNKKENDWSDVIGLYNTLHDPKRLTEPGMWRADLERRFEVKEFLKWLAISATLEHWDTYGAMAHNFFLYNHNGKLNWISWDHNLILGASFGGPPPNPPNPPPGGGGGNKPPRSSVSFDKTEVTDKWPLIRFLLDDPVFAQEYRDQLNNVKDRYFNAATIEADLRQRAKVIRPSLNPKELTNFESLLEGLIKKIYDRQQKLDDHLKST